MGKRAVATVLPVLLVFVISSALFHLCPVFGQQSPETPLESEPDALRDGLETSLLTLEAIAQSIDVLKAQIEQREAELRSTQVEDLQGTIVADLKKLSARLNSLEENFEEIATGLDLEQFEKKPGEVFELQDELEEIFGPILRELRNITARPREIERLRNETSYYQDRLDAIEGGIENIDAYIASAGDGMLRSYLENLKHRWEGKKQELSNRLLIVQYQLSERLKGKKSFVESVQIILKSFFKSRGRNLLLSLLAFACVWLLLYLLQGFIRRFFLEKGSPEPSIYTRLFWLCYHLFTFVAATMALLLVLYISADWVLVGLVIIFLFGLAWAMRHTMPRFWEQGKLFLNLSTVKENERVVYNGLPWKVERLHFYSTLMNPDLKGGLIRLPLRKLTDMHSRPYHPQEPWFPTREGDWVILADGTLGRVVIQTPEMVKLMLLGSSHKTYSTPSFLQQNPNNISTSFRITTTFGIDYQHQTKSTEEIPSMLHEMITEEISKAGYGEELVNLKVEFKEAGSSSLDIEVLADFSGKAAKYYRVLSRYLQRICVDACNRYGWIIPFTQITLHGDLPHTSGSETESKKTR
jgi:hypothetical protein